MAEKKVVKACLASLPTEIIEEIAKYLELRDLSSLAQFNERFTCILYEDRRRLNEIFESRKKYLKDKFSAYGVFFDTRHFLSDAVIASKDPDFVSDVLLKSFEENDPEFDYRFHFLSSCLKRYKSDFKLRAELVEKSVDYLIHLES